MSDLQLLAMVRGDLSGETEESLSIALVELEKRKTIEWRDRVVSTARVKESIARKQGDVGKLAALPTQKKIVRYVTAVIACSIAVSVYAIIGVLLGWGHAGGVIPMMILLAVLAATWRAITKFPVIRHCDEGGQQINLSKVKLLPHYNATALLSGVPHNTVYRQEGSY